MTERHHLRRRRLATAALLSAAVLGAPAALGACGVPLDDEPRVITQTTIAPAEQAPTTIAVDGVDEASVYYLRDNRLERVGYPVDGAPTLQQAITFVLEPPAEDADPALRSSVPPGTALRSVEVEDGVATIDVTTEINDVSGPTQKEAFAQIVFTALAFESIEQVRFLVEGEVIEAPTDDGNLEVVSADNYDAPLNPR